MKMYKSAHLPFLILNLMTILRDVMTNYEAEFQKLTNKMQGHPSH